MSKGKRIREQREREREREEREGNAVGYDRKDIRASEATHAPRGLVDRSKYDAKGNRKDGKPRFRDQDKKDKRKAGEE